MHDNAANQLGQFIPLHYHHHMLGDEARTSAFKAAINHVVPLGGRVLELGSGTGVLSYFAAQRAERVLAVEYNPQLVTASRRILAQNGFADKVTVVHADASTFTPDEPVDVVVCEMLHSALLREKQLEIIRGFKQRYQLRFGTLPRFVPEVTILAAQPLSQDYLYQGYAAPLPLFQDAASLHARSSECSAPQSYACIDYQTAFSERFEESLHFKIENASEINAVRFITKNFLAIFPPEQPSIDWHNQHLVLPLQQSIWVESGNSIEVRFVYDAGGSIEMLGESLSCVAHQITMCL
jgi:predicted RNA methylase